MRKLALIFFIFSTQVDSQVLSSKDSIYQLLLEQRYELVADWLDKNTNDKDYNSINNLWSVLKNRGSQKTQDSLLLIKSKAKIDFNNQTQTALIAAYYHLFYNKRSFTTLGHFDAAFILAKESDNNRLVKLSLIPFLEFYSRENTLNRADFDQYISEFKKVSESINDSLLVTIYRNLRESRSADYDLNIYHKTGASNISLYKENKAQLSLGLKGLLLENIGTYHKYNKNINEAIDSHQTIIDFPDNPVIRENKFNSFLDLGQIFADLERVTEARKMFDQAVLYIDQNDLDKQLVTYYKFRANYLHLRTKEFDSAYFYLNKAFNLNRRINYEDNSLKYTELNTRLRTAEKDAKIAIQEKENARTKLVTYGLGGTLGLGSIIAFLLYRNTKRKQRIAEQEKEIEIQKTEKILKEQELNTIDAMIAGQEKERQRLAGDLHDSVGATLSAAKMQFDHLKKNKGQLKNEEELFDSTSELLEEAYKEVRSMAHAKNAGVIAKNGLLPAVQKLAKNASVTKNLKIEVQDFGLEERLDGAMEIALFRMIQELVTNIIKHAEASEAHISITQHEQSINVMVEDNGRGFRASQKAHKEGMGLGSIEKRIEHLEGSFEVDSSPGKGTSISIDIPL
ncbi:MAG: sensor histidine kinase [Gilvibacter sp.]